MRMIRPFLQPDAQWIRALGAVVAGLLMVHGAMEVGGARTHQGRSAQPLATVAHCLASAALRDDSAAPARPAARQH
jgi:hypothetical protein